MEPGYRSAAIVLVLLVVVAVGGAAFLRSGAYDIGADAPHAPMTLSMIEQLRDASTKAHSRGIAVPPLDDPAKVAQGAMLYAKACTGCHLAPGMDTSDLRTGLYPQPPDLAKDGIDDQAEAFWIIKHGIKMSAMPAWGKTRSDAQVWNLVAFLVKLPDLSPAQYRQLVSSGREHVTPRP
jgi:mono/diheme cytochrome c family protein